jgi:sugar phosphate isomerase/epimerase
MKYAVFTVMTPEWSIEEALPRLKTLGMNGVEFRVTRDTEKTDKPGFWKGNRCTVQQDEFVSKASDLAKKCRDAGLETPVVGSYVRCDETETADKLMAATAALGAPALRIGVMGYNGEKNARDVFETSVEFYTKIAEMASEYRIKALAEIHPGNIIPSASQAARFASYFDEDQVGIILDPGNMITEGYENWRMGLELLGEYLAHVHVKNTAWKVTETLKDNTKIWKAGPATLAEGQVNWREMLETLRAVGYDGWLSFEDFTTGKDTGDKLRDNMVYIKNIVKGLPPVDKD